MRRPSFGPGIETVRIRAGQQTPLGTQWAELFRLGQGESFEIKDFNIDLERRAVTFQGNIVAQDAGVIPIHIFPYNLPAKFSTQFTFSHTTHFVRVERGINDYLIPSHMIQNWQDGL